MKKYLQNKLNNEKGMTLIELLAVIVIIAIIAAIAIPSIGSIIENSRNGAVKSDYQNALSSANIYFTENPSEPTVSVSVLAGKGTGVTTSYLDDQGSLQDAVLITKTKTGNTISGSAIANGKTYTLKSALTNSQLSSIKNADFTGAAIAPKS
ncbi:pilus assembly protein PilA [Planococcus kocurii]|uniref:Pilus assembly protein PilA n=1 Tax=Planococcus kocurii TaxID=1374 RepID=A0ABN4JVU4_9BACL|nr:prepilin-type N-terminal cleavage/methylation domain-containing protein [Planococcus kocurii]ALS78987.1 pilus assembly protein PilA [Planococcus kocurii]